MKKFLFLLAIILLIVGGCTLDNKETINTVELNTELSDELMDLKEEKLETINRKLKELKRIQTSKIKTLASMGI